MEARLVHRMFLVLIALGVTVAAPTVSAASGKPPVFKFGLAKTSSTAVTVIAGKPSIFAFTLSKKTVPQGVVTFKVKNMGLVVHDFKVCASSKDGRANSCVGKATKQISPGSSATLTVIFATKGTYEYLCTVPGHAASGMKGDLKVT
jgi:nitrite reductase (NO-forming)